MTALHPKVAAWVETHGWGDSAEDQMARALHFYDSIFKSREDVLEHWFIVIGNGHEWRETPDGLVLGDAAGGDDTPEVESEHCRRYEAFVARMHEERAERAARRRTPEEEASLDAIIDAIMEEARKNPKPPAAPKPKEEPAWYPWSEFAPMRELLYGSSFAEKASMKLRADWAAMLVEWLDIFEADIKARGATAFGDHAAHTDMADVLETIAKARAFATEG